MLESIRGIQNVRSFGRTAPVVMSISNFLLFPKLRIFIFYHPLRIHSISLSSSRYSPRPLSKRPRNFPQTSRYMDFRNYSNIKMSYSEIKRFPAHVFNVFKLSLKSEVLPKSERNGGKFKSALSAAVINHFFVSFVVSNKQFKRLISY